MSRRPMIIVLLITALSFGCSPAPSKNHGNVAVVDLDEVARQLGLSEQWSAELSGKQSSITQQLAGYQQQLNERLQTKKEEVVTASGSNAPLPKDQQTQLVSYQQELNEKLRLAQSRAQQHLTEERSRIIQSFRQQAAKVSAEVARQRGYDIVLTKNETVVLTLAQQADITKEVAERLKRRLEAGDFRP